MKNHGFLDKKTIFSLRHAPVISHGDNMCLGWSDLELVPNARELIQQTAFQLRSLSKTPLTLITSDTVRAHSTAEILSKYLPDCELRQDSRLRERNFGEYEQRPFESINHELPGFFDEKGELLVDAVLPGGESTTQHRKRIFDFLDSLLVESSENAICLVSHGMSIQLMHEYFTGVRFEYFRKNLSIEPLQLQQLFPIRWTAVAPNVLPSRNDARVKPFIFTTGTKPIDELPFEVLERKGLGHPDTICDNIAETISRDYSQYCLDHFQVILRHMVDKIAVQGGLSKVHFGGGEMLSPIRVALNGRFTKDFCGNEIPFREISRAAVHKVLSSATIDLDVEKWVKIDENFHHSQGPGVVYDRSGKSNNDRQRFFTVDSADSAQRHSNRGRANDTSTAVGFAPYSRLHRAVVDIEQFLNSPITKQSRPWIGTDIKVMGRRVLSDVDFTICAPLMAQHTQSAEFYRSALAELKEILIQRIENSHGWTSKIYLNSRDEHLADDFYMTITGSSIECGDEGAVGRGNRVGGVIPFTRRMSMEAPCGKNPVYHVGNVYTALAQLMSHQIHLATSRECCVYLTSRIGGLLEVPWSVAIELSGNPIGSNDENEIGEIIDSCLNAHPSVATLLIKNGITLA